VPELPTISESGVPGYDVTTWNGWLAPAGTPVAMINKLSVELARAVKSPDVTNKLLGDGGEPVGSTPEQFQQLIAVEIPRWHKVVNDIGLRAQ
jgi:tripartite-type tricarboxylate transporter receptor subunit TctC